MVIIERDLDGLWMKNFEKGLIFLRCVFCDEVFYMMIKWVLF